MRWTLLIIGLVALVAVGCESLIRDTVQPVPVVVDQVVTKTNADGGITVTLERTTNTVTRTVAVPGPTAEALKGMAETGLLGPWGEIAVALGVVGLGVYNKVRKQKAPEPSSAR